MLTFSQVMSSQVMPKPADDADAKWTVMVFMGADTIEGNSSLVQAAEDDLREMEHIKSGGRLNIFAQVHGKGVARRSHVGISPMTDVPADQQNPARGRALASFIRWAMMTAGHDPMNPKHYSMLVLWGHAYDFAFGRAQTRAGTIDALDFAELAQVLERLQEGFGAPSAKLDILGFDACDLATVEMACQLEPFASYLLGSQIGIPIPGWPYDRILERLRYPIGRLMGPCRVRCLCRPAILRIVQSALHPVSLSLLHLDRAPELFAHAEILALTLASAIGDDDIRDRIARLFARSQTGERRPYVDVADLCLNLVREGGDPLVVEAARALGDFLMSPRPPLVGKSAEKEPGTDVRSSSSTAATPARRHGSTASASTLPTWHSITTSRPCSISTTTSSLRRRLAGASSCTRSRD